MSPEPKHAVFHDPSGTRWKLARLLSTTAAVASTAAMLVLAVTVLIIPATPLAGQYRHALRQFTLEPQARGEAMHRYVGWRSVQALTHRLALSHAIRSRHRNAGKLNGTVVGFYVNWNPNSYVSFRQHVDALTYVMPEWLALSTGPLLYQSNFTPTSTDPEMLAVARRHQVPVVPILNNADQNNFQWPPLRQLLRDRDRQRRLALALRNTCVRHQYAGINVDFEPPYELMTDAEMQESRGLLSKALPEFIRTLHRVFAPAHLLVTQDIPVNDDAFDADALCDANDFVVLMFYDQHAAEDAPGPIASQEWVEQRADALFAKMDTSKVVLGLGNYCYDWPVKIRANGVVGSWQRAREMLMGPALGIASQARASIRMDEGDLNPYFTYADDHNQNHVVYFLDAVTAYNQYRALQEYGIKGAALWYLGSEDPSLWTFLDDDKLGHLASLDALKTVTYPQLLDVDSFPQGSELNRISAVAQPGTRQLQTDQDGLVTSETYRQYPSPYIIEEMPIQGKKIALTFDDGPDARYTPQLLDILRRKKVHATFFCVGNQVAENSGIVQRAWAEGNEIGNHTFSHPHIAVVPHWRSELELNATEMLLEGLIGHSTRLFRPPYGDAPDADTLAAHNTLLLRQLAQDNYVMVGMNIDPKDYLSPPPATIVQRVLEQLPGNHIVLLHDSGGNRQTTVAALPLVIDALQAKGYHLVTVSQLLGPNWHARLFPLVGPGQQAVVSLDRVLFEIWYRLQDLLRLAFLAAIFLGIGRILLLTPLVLAQSRREARFTALEASPAVTVGIPAYNEGAVVVRTVQSVLDSNYPGMQVIVVDDGSTDGTSKHLLEAYGGHPQVEIITKENGGKSSALEVVFARATTPVVVCLDADTLLQKDTIQHLVQPFSDARVGAVAGNVKVGNRINPQTIWQSLEYVTAQNFDRRAFSLLNSVAVVPGAVGAWRTAAVREVGGFRGDTLAEDTDLTFRIRLAGYYTRACNQACGYTEAPDTIRMLARQRFRWAFGTLQVLWKHKRQLFSPRHGWFSMLVMPTMWAFSIWLQAMGPIVDLTVLMALFNGQLMAVLYYAAVFFMLDLGAAIIAIRLDDEDPKMLIWLFWQRFFYRQFMYYTIVRALMAALRGRRHGWGQQQRKSTVTVPTTT